MPKKRKLRKKYNLFDIAKFILKGVFIIIVCLVVIFCILGMFNESIFDNFFDWLDSKSEWGTIIFLSIIAIVYIYLEVI